MKVALITLGCRVNQAESSILEGTLRKNGATIVSLNDNPDYCIVNTCSVTAKSDYNSRQVLRRAGRTGARVIVTGCYSQLMPRVVKEIPGVTDLIDINRKHEIIGLVTGTQHELVYNIYSRSRPYLKVQDGCNFRCSYCSVPIARGNSRSLPVEEVIRRALDIESSGFHEVVLTGIHLGIYGHDFKNRITLADLLKKLLLRTTRLRIRLSSLEISEVGDALIELLQESRLCKHLHLPLQSGSTRILNLMKRCYSPDYFEKQLNYISNRIDNIAVGSDVIVGFPGEGDAEFTETYDLLKSLPISYLHIFPFSPRQNTEAADMSGRPAAAAVTGRVRRLKELHLLLKKGYMTRQLGRQLDVIFEEEFDGGTCLGTSGNYLKVSGGFAGYAKGDIITVRAEGIAGMMIEGSVIRTP